MNRSSLSKNSPLEVTPDTVSEPVPEIDATPVKPSNSVIVEASIPGPGKKKVAGIGFGALGGTACCGEGADFGCACAATMWASRMRTAASKRAARVLAVLASSLLWVASALQAEPCRKFLWLRRRPRLSRQQLHPRRGESDQFAG
jgi:hypothetical protein